jgi:hypothetical protein
MDKYAGIPIVTVQDFLAQVFPDHSGAFDAP